MIERIVCINLKRRADRWQEFAAGCPLKVERFEAIDGKSGAVIPVEWLKNSRGAGAWGCFQSHLQIFKQCLQSNIESVLIFEDDALFLSGFKYKYEQFMHHLPNDWAMFYLGGQHLKPHEGMPQQVNEFVYSAYNVNRTHAYAVHKHMFKTLIHHLEKETWLKGAHIDHHMGRLHQNRHDIYTPKFWMVGQRTSYSDVTQQNAEVNFWLSAYRIKSLQAEYNSQ